MAKPAKKVAPKDDEVEVFQDVEQGSEDWFRLRLGMCTASNFATIMAGGVGGGESKTRALLLRKLAGEILTGEPAENYSNAAMQRGNAMEAAAREHYAKRTFADIAQVGFVKRTINNPLGVPLVIGASPDAFVGKDRVLEIKTMRPDLLIEVALKGAGGFPPEHRAQCQGTLWVTGRDECDLMLFYTGMPIAPTFLVERDDVYIRRIAEEVEKFDWELHQLVAKIRGMGR